MKYATSVVIVVILIVAVIVLSSSMYVVREDEQVVITQFGKPVGDAKKDAGLYFKTPFVQDVNRFTKKIIEWDGDKGTYQTKDKQTLWVDTTARWKIVDPLIFLQKSAGNIQRAQTLIDDNIDNATNDQIRNHPLNDIVRDTNRILDLPANLRGIMAEGEIVSIKAGREKINVKIFEQAKATIHTYGMELIDVKIKTIDFVQSLKQDVYRRMIAERNRIAEKLRSEGRGEKAKIEGQREKERKTIMAEARLKSQQIKATAEAAAARIYADAYSKDREFYTFYRLLETYEKSIGKNMTFILSTDGELFELFKSRK